MTEWKLPSLQCVHVQIMDKSRDYGQKQSKNTKLLITDEDSDELEHAAFVSLSWPWLNKSSLIFNLQSALEYFYLFLTIMKTSIHY